MSHLRIAATIAALALIVIVLGCWVMREGEPRPPSPGPSPQSSATASAASAPPAPSAASAAAAAEARVAVPMPPPTGLRIQVVDRQKQPIAGATIEVRGDDDELTFPPTGADGWTQSARLPAGDVDLFARTAVASGHASWRWTSTFATEVTIWLIRNRDVEVSVTDRLGAPHLGVGVGLFADGSTGWRTPSAKATTGDDGVARFHVDGTTWLAAHATMCAVAGHGGTSTASETIAWADDGPTRVTIVLDLPAVPPGPLVRVRFVATDGAPAAAKGKLMWARIMVFGVDTFVEPAGETEVDGAEARVAPLLDGDHIRLRLWEEGRLESELELRLPVGANEHQVSLPRGAIAPRLEIPVVDAAGQPVTSGAFAVTVLLQRVGYERESTVQPDSRGVLSLPLDEALAGAVEVAEPHDTTRLHWPEPKRLVRPYRSTIGRERVPNPPLAVLEFACPAPGQVVKLPPVVVPEVAPRIHGRVIDADDQPVAGVRIWLSSVTLPEPEAFAAFATRTDSDGRFSIRATKLPDEVFVGGRRPLGFCAPVRVRPSAVPVTLRLQPTGAIATDLRATERPSLPEVLANQWPPRITLRIDEDALVDGWWLFFRKRRPIFESEYRDRWSAMRPLEERGECWFRDLVPGVYRILGSVGDNPVLDVPGVRVVAGETTRPPGGQRVGAGIEAGCVRALGSEGRPFADAHVRVMLPEWKSRMQDPAWCDTDKNGEAWFLVPRGALGDIEVAAPGVATCTLPGAAFPASVTIGVGTSFEFAISGLAAMQSAGRPLLVGCLRLDGAAAGSPVQTHGEQRYFRHPLEQLDHSGRATIPNLQPGTYRLWLGAMPSVGGAAGPTFVLLGDRVVGTAAADRVAVEHAVSEAEIAVLLGR